MTEHVDVKVKVLDARLAIQSLTTAIEAYDSLLPIPRTLIFEHLQEMHGLALDGEWNWCPPQWRKNAMSREALKSRHTELHEEDIWNEASERHEHTGGQ
jgi:hypothetical protein